MRILKANILGMLVLVIALTLSLRPVFAETSPVIAAASSLRFVMADITAAFTDETGLRVRLTYGSSGNITRQILQGAPFQMFLSADESYVAKLAAAGLTEGIGKTYAEGRIVLFIANGSRLDGVEFPDGYEAAFSNGEGIRLALANPVHAPYGRAARQALVHAGLWKTLEPSLLYGENVSQAGQFAASGSADGGFIAQSLALALSAFGKGSFQLIPASWHEPLEQRMVLVKGAGDTARKFFAFMSSEKARKLLTNYGFGGVLP